MFSSGCYILMYSYTSTYMQNHNDTINKQTSEVFFIKIRTSHFIVRVRKGLLRVWLWEGVGDRTELQYFEPTLMAISVVSFSSSWCSTEARGLSFLLSAGLLYHILWPTGLQNYWGAQKPLRPEVAFPTTSCLQLQLWLLVMTELYNSSTPTQSPTQSLEWHVWSSSSGNNCRAVHRSLSSGASV